MVGKEKGKSMLYSKRNLAPVPTEVFAHVKKYLLMRLPQYELVKIIRASDHIEDDYLYMVSAKHKENGTYTVWTCWNESTQSLNFGHYGLSEDGCEEIFNEFFYSINNY